MMQGHLKLAMTQHVQGEIIKATGHAKFYRRFGHRWIATAICPRGYWIQACESHPVNFDDGVKIGRKMGRSGKGKVFQNSCSVVSKGGSGQTYKASDISVTVTCSRTQKTVVVTSSRKCGIGCTGG